MADNGYRKIAELLRRAGRLVNDKLVEQIWRREGLKPGLWAPGLNAKDARAEAVCTHGRPSLLRVV
jgi:hypothetical protein